MILLLLLGAAAASALFLWRKDREVQSPIARITRDGVLLEEIALDKVEQPYTLDVTDRSGSNTLLVERGRIRGRLPRSDLHKTGVYWGQHCPYCLPAPQIDD